MGRKRNSALGAATALLLAGCGAREELRPAPGQSLPVAPAASATAPSTEDMLAPSPIARPERVDEPILRSQERPDDRFDLPPS
jgi:hypothetical protein